MRPSDPRRSPQGVRPYVISAILALAAAGSLALAAPRAADRKVNVAGSTELRGSAPAAAARPPTPPRPPVRPPLFARIFGEDARAESRPFAAAAYDGLGFSSAPFPIAPVTSVRTAAPAVANADATTGLSVPEVDWRRLEAATVPFGRDIGSLPIVADRRSPPPDVPDPSATGAFRVPTRLLREKTVAPHTNPDLDIKVNDRTTIGVFGDLSPAAKVDPRSIDVRKGDVGAGLTLQYKFQSR